MDPVKSVDSRIDLGGGRYLDPAPEAVPAFTTAEIRQLPPRLNSQTTVDTIVIGYYHDPANEQPGDEPRLVYLVTFAQQECVPTAPAPPPGDTAMSVAPVPCNPAEIIDATTGSTVISIVGQSPPAAAP
jgi:hypothetical protein